jgi:hypothetical protein
MVRRLVLLVALVAGLLGTGIGPASAAPPAPADAERQFLDLLNSERATANLPALTADAGLVPIAREWSQNMANTNVLSHRPDLRAQVEARVTRDWRRIGENVGRGPEVPGLHVAFMNSPGHRANVLGDYNRVGIAVVNAGSTIWVTFNFLKGPAIAPAPAPAPPPNVPPTNTRTIDDACPSQVPRGTFVDVPASNVHARPIDCVAWWEVAGGVTTKSYAPAAPVNRAQMASFVARAIDAAGYVLPASPADAFGDDNGSVHERSINQLAAVGVVTGVRPGVFAPGDLVTRAQMATFLVRAYDLIAVSDLPNVGNRFVDVDGTAHEANINKAAGAGLAGGTEFGYFSPLADVSRAQLASFLARTLDLLVQDGGAAARA